MRLIAEITKSPDGRLEGDIRCGDDGSPIHFSGVLDLLRILEDEIPPGSATVTPGASDPVASPAVTAEHAGASAWPQRPTPMEDW